MSIQLKLLCFVVCTMAIATAAIVLVINQQFITVIDANQHDLYHERVDTILGILQGYDERLRMTGQEEAYREGFQELALEALSKTYYDQPNQQIFPFIINRDGDVIMHPAHSAGNQSLDHIAPAIKKIYAAAMQTSGSLEFEKQWYVYQLFTNWDWVVAYVVPLDMKYAEVRTLRQILFSIMIGVTTLSVLIMSWAIIRITRPIRTLTEGARAIAAGDYSSAIDETGSGEIQQLTCAFNQMAEAVNTKVLALQKEIAERQRAEEALRQLETKQRAMIANISDVIMIIGKDGIIQYTSPNVERWFGWQPQELVGTDGWFRIHPDDLTRIQQEFSTILEKEKAVKTVEYRSQSKNGSYKSIQMTALNLTNDPIIHGVLLNYHDISERKKVERELYLYRLHLEELVSERTAALQTANDELKSFAYIASHDLRAPLRGINQLTHWLSTDYADVIDEPGKEMMELLIGRVKHMDNLIRGILQYSRIGRKFGQDDPIELNTLVAEIIETLAPPAHITVTIDNELPTIIGDRIRLMQVFQNLIGNAIKFLGASTGEVRIGCAEEESQWKFWVADTGPGIEEQHYDRIFQIFQTLGSHDEQESTGIGLAIVKKIVEFYHGKIWVESRVGQGSTFFFRLPKEKTAEN